jgi:hypothetical protein
MPGGKSGSALRAWQIPSEIAAAGWHVRPDAGILAQKLRLGWF